jgi:NAD(P)-dependent dehydrogenase (short-subunit alcohol dehydrogenase family)
MATKRILIIGADTPIGKQIWNVLNQQDTQLKVLVATEASAKEFGTTKVIVGKAANQLTLKRAMQNTDIVINALIDGRLWRPTNAATYKAILQEFGQDKRKLIVALTRQAASALDKFLANTVKRFPARDLKQAIKAVNESQIAHTVLDITNSSIESIAAQVAQIISDETKWNYN